MMTLPERWRTPAGRMTARIHERYVGLHGQERIALVDLHGRVHHFDAERVHLLDEDVPVSGKHGLIAIEKL